MLSSREDLLNLLRDACFSGQEIEQLLRYGLAHRSAPPDLLPDLERMLAQTLGQQQLLAQSVARIRDAAGRMQAVSPSPAATYVVPDAADPCHASILPDLRDAMLRDIDFYATLIDTAESTGFFETKLICQGILAQKSSAFEWLAVHGAPARG